MICRGSELEGNVVFLIRHLSGRLRGLGSFADVLALRQFVLTTDAPSAKAAKLSRLAPTAASLRMKDSSNNFLL